MIFFNKKYYFDVFSRKKYFKLQLLSHSQIPWKKKGVKHRLYIKFPIKTPTTKINNISSCMYTSFCNGKIPETNANKYVSIYIYIIIYFIRDFN